MALRKTARKSVKRATKKSAKKSVKKIPKAKKRTARKRSAGGFAMPAPMAGPRGEGDPEED